MAIILAAAAMTLLVLWAGVSAALGARYAAGARDDAALLQQQAAAGDTAAAAATLASLQTNSEGLGRWLGGAPWTGLTWLPVVGDTLSATTLLANSAEAVVVPLAPAAAAVLTSADGSMAGTAAALAEQQAGFVAAGAAAAAAAADIAAIDPATMIAPAADPVAAVQEQFADALPGVTGLAAASVVLPGLLGIDGPTQWVLAATQPAEARGSGAGFFGAYGVMSAEAGRLELAQARPNNEVFDLRADLSVLPPEFAALWGESAAYIWGHNLTRHFPYAAQLLAQTASRTGAAPDYVVALNPRVVAALLQLTGPVTAAGVTIDAESAEEYLTGGIYQQFPDSDTKDKVSLELMATVLVALQQSAPSPSQALAALAGPLSQQNLVVWAADPQQQQVLERSVVAGALPVDPLELTVAFNNGGGNKLDVYLQTAVDVALQGCGVADKGTVTIDLGLAGVPPGLVGYIAGGVRGPDVYAATRQLVHVYGPPGARLLEMTIDGVSAPLTTGTEQGRPVWGTEVDLVPEVPRTVTATFDADLPPTALKFLPQPLTKETIVTLRDDRSCP